MLPRLRCFLSRPLAETAQPRQVALPFSPNRTQIENCWNPFHLFRITFSGRVICDNHTMNIERYALSLNSQQACQFSLVLNRSRHQTDFIAFNFRLRRNSQFWNLALQISPLVLRRSRASSHCANLERGLSWHPLCSLVRVLIPSWKAPLNRTISRAIDADLYEATTGTVLQRFMC